MNRTSIFAAVLAFGVLAISPSMPAQAGWASQSPGPASLRDVCAVNATTVYTLGGDEMVRSDDGGASWGNALSGFGVLSRCAFSSPVDGWVTRAAQTVFHTSNGVNWQLQNPGTTDWPYAVFALSPATAWVSSITGEISRTTDGTNWAKVGQVPSGITVEALFFIDSMVGYAGDYGGSLWRSGDGGTTWSFLSGGPARSRITAIHCSDVVTCIAVGEDSGTGIALSTTDGGSGWTSLSVPTTSIYYDVECTTSDACWIVGDSSLAAVTRDRGASWQEFRIGSGLTLLGSDFVALDLGWVAAQEGFLWKFTNAPPIAKAGDDRTVPRGPVGLDGRQSADPDGDSVRFLWSQVQGPPVNLTGADAPEVTITVSEIGTYVFELTVEDALGAAATDSVVVTVVNQDPIAYAGADQLIPKGTPVTLNAGGSFDPDGDSLEFSWFQMSGPPSSLSGSNSIAPSFTPGDSGTYVFSVTVTDGFGGSSSDAVSVGAHNRDPAAHAGPNLEVLKYRLVTLSGAASMDPDGDPLTFSWSQTGGPPVALLDATAPNPSFTPPFGGTYTFVLVVDDGDGGSSTDSVTVTATNAPPIVNAGADIAGTVGTSVRLTGSGADPDGDSLTFVWTQASGPAITLIGASTLAPTFTPSEPGTYRFVLAADDGDGGSATDEVQVIVEATPPPPPPQDAPPIVAVLVAALFLVILAIVLLWRRTSRSRDRPARPPDMKATILL